MGTTDKSISSSSLMTGTGNEGQGTEFDGLVNLFKDELTACQYDRQVCLLPHEGVGGRESKQVMVLYAVRAATHDEGLPLAQGGLSGCTGQSTMEKGDNGVVHGATAR